MRVAHVTDCYLPRLGGIELQVHDLAARQAEMGHKVSIHTTTEGSTSPVPTDLEVLRSCRPDRAGERIMYRQTRRGVAGFMDQLDTYDAVHVHASSFSPLAFLAAHHASRRGVPTVATVHSLWAKATPLFRAADVLTGWADWPVEWSAVSNAAARSIRSVVRGRSVVHILPNGVDPAEWHTGPAPTSRSHSGLHVAVVSRLARRKRTLQLVQMLDEVRAGLPAGTGIRVEILGDGPQRADIERYLSHHGMEEWVNLQGRRTRAEIREVFDRSDVFVAPASLESFGIAALEARCAGLPVLARSGTGVADFVRPGQEGWLVGSDAEMVEKLIDLARSPGMLQAVARHNRTVPASIDWIRVLSVCEALYRRASDRHGRTWSDLRLPHTPPGVAAQPVG